MYNYLFLQFIVLHFFSLNPYFYLIFMNMHQGLTDWIIGFNYILALIQLKWNNHKEFFIRYSDSCILYLKPAFLCSHNNMIIIIIIHVISIFKEDNIF